MTPEQKKIIVERYTGWAENWGLSFAFAVTQSVDKSEIIVSDAIAALVATDIERASLPISATRFASVLWETANVHAYRGFGTDTFFRMPAVARAIVILKIRAQLSRQQIADALRISLRQVDDHLENSRLLFSEGRSWLLSSPNLTIEEDRWTPECPQWKATAPRSSEELGLSLQDIFAQYVGNDLDADQGHKLHSHLLVCTTCRTSFAHFKKQYLDWAGSIPAIEVDAQLRKELTKVTRMALRVKRRGPPSPWPGLHRILRDAQVRALLLGGMSLLFLHLILRR